MHEVGRTIKYSDDGKLRSVPDCSSSSESRVVTGLCPSPLELSATLHLLGSALVRPGDENLPPLPPSCHWLPGISESRDRARCHLPNPARHIAYSCQERGRES